MWYRSSIVKYNTRYPLANEIIEIRKVDKSRARILEYWKYPMIE